MSKAPVKQAKSLAHHPYIISKRTPTQFNTSVKPIISEQNDCAYVANGNIINVYSLTTNILISTLRSKRQQAQGEEGKPSPKGDVHKGFIIAMALLPESKLLSLCTQGILAQWDVSTDSASLIDIYELHSVGKINQAVITQEKIAIYDSKKRVFKIFDSATKTLLHTLDEFTDNIGIVNDIVVQGNTFAYIRGRILVMHNLLEMGGKGQRLIQRDSLLRTLSINEEASLIALGDDFGKIYLVHINSKQLIVQTLHWHAHRVSTLQFIPDTPYLLSGGEEAVIVQWHLETQTKSFISRLGSPILNIGLSSPNQTYYTVTMSDNSVKVIRFDNNKVKTTFKSIQLERDPTLLEQAEITFNNGSILVPYKNELQEFNIDERQLYSLQIKAKNFVSRGNKSDVQPETLVKSYCLTPDQKNLVTYEELRDVNAHKDIRVQTLKFWRREIVQDGFEGFEVIYMVHDPSQEIDSGLKISAINNRRVCISNGSRIQIWEQSGDNARGHWSILTQFEYQQLKVIQSIPNVRLRLQLDSNAATQGSPSIKCLAFLHQEGHISFWDQDTLEFIYSFKLNQPAKKIIFESSFRYLASLTSSGSVEVWKLKGQTAEKHWWDLNFHSVKDLQNNPGKENQFLLTMNHSDEQTSSADSILLFQYSRPQNLIMYWKAQLAFLRVVFCDQSIQSSSNTSYLLIITKNLELQKIYFGITRDDLKNIAQKRRNSLDVKLKQSEKAIESQKRADYTFIQNRQTGGSVGLQQRKETLLQEAQIKRLDKVDKLLGDDKAAGSFLGMASLSYYFDQFAQEMLSKPSKATNLIDLQEEIMRERHQNQNQEDVEMKYDGVEGGFEDQNELVKAIEVELANAFEGLLK